MRYPISKTIAATAITLVLLVAVSAAMVATVRHVASAAWNSPDGLDASPENPQVHYEQGASEYARAVAALLPAAIARVEKVHGRPFAHPVTIGAYASKEAFAAANGLGHATTWPNNVSPAALLSPALFADQRQRLPAIPTHELSHAHLQSWISLPTYIHVPNWFKEGLGVMVSEGGGAERVSEIETRDAIRRGNRIAIASEGSSLNLSGIKFVQPDTASQPVMAYRQAGLFVTFLYERSPTSFTRMMAAMLDGHPFAVRDGRLRNRS
jgi:hypothetical protein